MSEVNVYFIFGFIPILLFLVFKYTYWWRRNVPSPIAVPLLGNYGSHFTMKKTEGESAQDVYNRFPDAPYVGAYYGTEPVLIPKDLDMIKTIMAKDFNKFSGRLLVDHEYRDPLFSSNLFSTSGDNWKAMRQNMNPLFTSGKLKSFFDLIKDCGNKLDKYLEDITKESDVVNARDMATKFILECIGSTLFGLKFDVLAPGSQSLKKIADAFETQTNLNFIQNTVKNIWPNIYFTLFSNVPASDDLKTKLFELAKESFESRNYYPNGRNDFIDFLLRFKDQGFIEGTGFKINGEKKVKIPVNEQVLVSQVLLFFGAGYHTSSNAISFTLFELAMNKAVQDRLLKEIDEILDDNEGHITYDSIQQYKYLDQCVSESIRKYPVLGVLTREAMVPYKFEDYNLKVDKGTRIHIPVLAIHMDPKYYPDPEVYDPERYSPENKAKRHQFTNLGFGEGQRICIGLRLAKIQVALGLIKVLSKYRVEPCETTTSKIEFDPKQFALTARHPLNVRMVRRR